MGEELPRNHAGEEEGRVTEPVSDADLVRMWRDQAPLPLPYFDNQEVELFFEDEEEVLHAADSIRAFLSLGPSDRLCDTRHVLAYFRDFTADAGFEWCESGLAELASDEEIWRHVYPTSLGMMESWDLGTEDRLRQFIVLEANCGWEQEHGLLMSWRDGAELVRVSGYDGHATHGHAYADVSKDAFVYYAQNARFSTTS